MSDDDHQLVEPSARRGPMSEVAPSAGIEDGRRPVEAAADRPHREVRRGERFSDPEAVALYTKDLVVQVPSTSSAAASQTAPSTTAPDQVNVKKICEFLAKRNSARYGTLDPVAIHKDMESIPATVKSIRRRFVRALKAKGVYLEDDDADALNDVLDAVLFGNAIPDNVPSLTDQWVAWNGAQAKPRVFGASYLAEEVGAIPWKSSHSPIRQVKSYLEALGGLRGRKMDKSALPHMAVVGVGGQGKTTLLKLLQLYLDSDFGKPVKGLEKVSLPTVEGVSSWIVVVATFNQGTRTAYNKRIDTEGSIRATTAARWLNDFVGDTVNLPHRESLDFEDAAKMLRARRGLPEQQVGLLLCVDELMKITDEATSRELLNAIAEFQQHQVEAGFMTAIIVTSLEVKPVANAWVVRSKRPISPITLPPLDVDVFLALMEDRLKLPETTMFRLRGVAHMSAGHGRLLEQLFRKASDSQKPQAVVAYSFLDSCISHVKFGSDAAYVMFWLLMARRLCAPDVPIIYNDPANIPSQIVELAANHSVVWHLDENGRIIVEPVPLALLSYREYDRQMDAMGLPKALHTSISNAIHILKDALHDSGETKNWETGIIAAMALRSAAWITTNGCAPTLLQLLPHATFSDESLKEWKMDVLERNGFTSLHNLNAVSSRDPGSYDSKTLLVSAEIENQAAIEGCLFVQDNAGNTVTLVTQMKLRKQARSSKEVLGKIVKFMQDHKGDRAALYCATGTAAQHQVSNDLKGKLRYIIIDSDGALQLLSALGQTRLSCRIVDATPTSKPQ